MSEVNDRGTKKWVAMMMPEHEEMLRKMLPLLESSEYNLNR